MKYTKIKMQNEAKKIVDSILGNNITFYCQVALLRQIIFNESPKEHTKIITGEWEDQGFIMNSMEQMRKIFSRSCENKNTKRVI